MEKAASKGDPNLAQASCIIFPSSKGPPGLLPVLGKTSGHQRSNLCSFSSIASRSSMGLGGQEKGMVGSVDSLPPGPSHNPDTHLCLPLTKKLGRSFWGLFSISSGLLPRFRAGCLCCYHNYWKKGSSFLEIFTKWERSLGMNPCHG